MFECDCCGLCCMNIASSPLYVDLDRGDGICIHFNYETKLCNIYESRPTRCNVDKTYDLYFRQIMTREDYYKLNYIICEKLKKEGMRLKKNSRDNPFL